MKGLQVCDVPDLVHVALERTFNKDIKLQQGLACQSCQILLFLPTDFCSHSKESNFLRDVVNSSLKQTTRLFLYILYIEVLANYQPNVLNHWLGYQKIDTK